MGRVAGMLWVALALVFTLAAQASAQPAGATCSPTCREGFSCIGGACQAVCNPPCPAGTVCVDGRRCEAVAATCNPPCPDGTSCVDGRRCESATASQCVPACREGYACSNGECVAQPGQGVTITPGTGPVEPATPVAPATPTGTETTAGAEDAEDTGPRTLLFKMRFGMGGTLSWEDESNSTSDERGLTGTIGAAVEKDWILISPVIDISLGLQLSGLWWNTQVASDLDVGRSTMFELDGVLKFSYTILPGFHAYLALPIGLTASFMRNHVTAGVFTDVGVGWGWNLSVLGGVQYDLSFVALFIELGADVHNFSHTVSNGNGGAEQELSFNFAQFALNLGLAF